MRHKFSTLVLISYLTVAIGAGVGCIHSPEGDDPSAMAITITPATPTTYTDSISEPTAGDAVLSAQLRVNNTIG